jgi:hypothetical protein
MLMNVELGSLILSLHDSIASADIEMLICWLGEPNTHNMEREKCIQNISVMMIDKETRISRRTTLPTLTYRL